MRVKPWRPPKKWTEDDEHWHRRARKLAPTAADVRILVLERLNRLGRYPFPPGDSSDQQRPDREPLSQMREAYEHLLPVLGGLTIKAQHDRVLRDLGIKGDAEGYGYETFRTKVAVRVKREKS